MARRDRKPDAGLYLVAEDEGDQQIGSAQPPQFGERQHRRRHRRGRMNHRAQMGVAEVMDIGAGGVEKGRTQRIDALGAPDHGRLLAIREFSERAQRNLDRTGAAARQRYGEEIHQRALGLMPHRQWNIVPPRGDPYDLLRDFAPVTMTTAYPYIMVVNPALGVKTLQEFVALARSKPGELNYGTTGVGAANHLVTELFDSKAGIRMTHIPYRGTALAVADLIAGQVQVVFADPISALQHIDAGTLLALAVTSKERSPVAPQVPTISESSYPGFDAIAWHGILAPANTPPAIINRLNAEIVQALQDPETRALLEKQAMQTVGNSPQAFASFIKQDIAIWEEVADQAKVEVR
jgi:tripartite-type tricarboxylate transporter receptor subunit TctC